ncbi:uncharacterized protein [Diabrotica undecimpunctata]|uniref:uncharacterized protein n=1 Tax=Diabrotica undecimpunctata TaxID=50387 RepID=UPI003B63FD71
MLTNADKNHYHRSVRLIQIEKTSAQCGFHLTRSKWDPYPWVSSVDNDSAASSSGLKTGDCVLEVNGEDILGKRISEIAEIVKSKPEQVSLLLWNADIDAHCTHETLCCGPLPRQLQKLSSCLTTILAFLECPVCLDTISCPTYQCDNGHLICIKCRSKTERCPVCRIRLHRGRSLMADHVFTAITDIFAPYEETKEARVANIQKIFKKKDKNKAIPDITITESYTNKLISKIVGKSSSADNLSTTSKYLTIDDAVADNNSQLKVKSLSVNEIFTSHTPALSRNGSRSGLDKTYLSTNNTRKTDERPISFHGSFESLGQQADFISPLCSSFNSLEVAVTGGNAITSYYCPFLNSCSSVLKATSMFEHFVKNHSETGPLVQYFADNLNLYLRDFHDNQEYCYTVLTLGQTFFLKIKLFNGAEQIKCTSNILIWVWHLGCEKSSRNYEVQIEIRNVLTQDVLLGARSSVFSLNSVSPQEVEEFKKGVYLSDKSIEALGLHSSQLLVKMSSFEHE